MFVLNKNVSDRNVIFIFFILFLSFLSINSINNFFPEYIHNNFNYNREIIYGFIISAFPLGQFLGSFIVIGCAKKIGLKKTFTIFVSLGAIFSFLLGISFQISSLNLLYLSRFLCGFFESSVILSRYYIVKNSENELLKNKRLGLISSTIAVGFIVGPLMSGYLYQINHNLCYYFSFISYIPCVYLVTRLHNIKINDIDNTNIVKVDFFKKIKNMRILKNIFSKSNVTLFSLCFFLYLASDLFYNYLPLFLNLHYKLSIVKISLILSLTAFIKLIFTFNVHKLKRNYTYLSVLFSFSIFFCLNVVLICILPYYISLFFLIMQSLINTALNNFLIFYLTSKDSLFNINNSISNIVRYRALVSSFTAILGGTLSFRNYFLPMIYSIIFMILFVISLYLWREIRAKRSI